MGRVILHSDMNAFYASVELLYHPELRGKPVAVGGDAQRRHGIVLAKNDLAKKFGVKTAMPLWEATRLCPDIVFVPPNFDLYLRYSKMADEIYSEYSPQREGMGIDEQWVELTGNTTLIGKDGSITEGEKVAHEIRKRILKELGVTVSIGVSFNKIFAKLGSDMKKPNAVTLISRENFKEKVWDLPVGELLYVGRKTQEKLARHYIKTIGQLANTDTESLKRLLGKNGTMLWRFANGYDNSPVSYENERQQVKSVGNSTTTYKDLVTDDEVKIVFGVLAESVAMRLRAHGFKCKTIQISLRNNKLISYERQFTLPFPLCTARDIAGSAFDLYKKHHNGDPLRSVGIRAVNLVDDRVEQLTFDEDILSNAKREHLERTVATLRERFGNFAVQSGNMLFNEKLSGINPKDDHIIFPVGMRQ